MGVVPGNLPPNPHGRVKPPVAGARAYEDHGTLGRVDADTPAHAPHRKRVKHREVLHGTRLLTFSCYRRLPLLSRDGPRRMLARAVERAVVNHGWLLHGFVFMPEHVHLLVRSMREACNAPALLAAIKRPTSFRVKKALEAEAHPLLGELTIRERPGKAAFRFWQEGPGHDANVGHDGVPRVLRYIHLNPVRRGLCAGPEEWAWSSARQYSGLEPLTPWTPRVTLWDHMDGGWLPLKGKV